MRGLAAKPVSAGILVVLIFIPAAPAVRADTILSVPSGFQLLSSDPGTKVKLSAPAGTFGQQSNALSDALSNVIIDSVGFGGSGPGPQSPFQFDEPIEATGFNFGKVIWAYKNQDPSAPMKFTGWTLPNFGSTAHVSIEMISFSLQSTSPLQVTYGNGSSSSFFDVFTALLLPAQTGILDLERTGESSGTYSFSIPIQYQMTFVNTVPGGPQANGPLVFTDTLAASGKFTVVPEPASAVLLSVSLVGIALCWIKRITHSTSSLTRFAGNP